MFTLFISILVVLAIASDVANTKRFERLEYKVQQLEALFPEAEETQKTPLVEYYLNNKKVYPKEMI